MSERAVLHVVLGAGGAIGTPLAAGLVASGAQVRTVSRSGRGPEAAEKGRGDLTRADDVLRGIDEGASV